VLNLRQLLNNSDFNVKLMIITWFGQSSFKIQDKNLILLTDPFGPDIGLKPVRAKADVITITHAHNDHNYLNGVMGDPFVINQPGEYEVKGVYILGIPCFHDQKEGRERGTNIIYRYSIEGMTLVHLGDLGHLLSEEIIHRLGNVDILFVPVGGVYTLAVDKIPDLISQIEPRLVIPMHYKLPGLKFSLGPLSGFCGEMGISSGPKLSKLKIKKKDCMTEKTEIKILERH